MSMDTHPAVPRGLSRAVRGRDNDRLVKWLSSAASALTAAISALVVAVVALALGIT